MEGIYRFVLTNVEQAHWTESWTVDETTLPLGAGHTWRVQKTTLKGGLQDGVDLIEVDNGALSLFIVPTRGMGIWKGIYRGIPLGWESPVRDLVNPAFVELNDRGGLGWLKGFNEWIVRCGLDSNGAPGNDVVIDNNGNEAEVFVPLHGKIANTPARHVEVQIELSPPHRITVFGIVDETMMFGPALRLTTAISTELGSNSLTIADQVTNLNHKPAELQLLYHCNYGAPLLEKGASLVAPFKTVSPRDPRAREDIKTHDRFSGPTPNYVEQVYFYELTGKRGGNRDTAILLKNSDASMGSSLHFSLKQMPCFSLWKNTAATEDGYVTGLEPATNYPNPKRFERSAGRVVQLNKRETQHYDLTIAVHDTKRGVQNAEREIKQLQKNAKPKVSENIISRLSSDG
jgi:hypothetical protein